MSPLGQTFPPTRLTHTTQHAIRRAVRRPTFEHFIESVALPVGLIQYKIFVARL